MRLADAAEEVFARHETFHPRYGWFRKAYTTAAANERGFTAEDAPVEIGVGKNMVRSIKFWGLAAKIITKDPDSVNKRSPDMIPTRFGHSLFGPDGWDPYMEDPGTVWLLHWMLLARRSMLPVWWLTFNELHAVNFDDELLAGAVTAQIEAAGTWSMPHHSAVEKDVSALLRTYAPAERTSRTSFDDLLDCPMRELGLIVRSAATSNHRFVLGRKPTLPDEIVGAAVLDYLSRCRQNGHTITLAHLANEPGSPGRAFRLGEQDLHSALGRVARKQPAMELLTTSGAQQIAWKTAAAEIAIDVLNDYYDIQPEAPAIGLDSDKPVDRDLLLERSEALSELLEANERLRKGARV